jgi:hypothetical protein
VVYFTILSAATERERETNFVLGNKYITRNNFKRRDRRCLNEIPRRHFPGGGETQISIRTASALDGIETMDLLNKD